MGAARLILVIALSDGEVEALFDTLQPGVDPVESVRVVIGGGWHRSVLQAGQHYYRKFV